MSWLTKIGAALATLFVGGGGNGSGQSAVSRAIDYASERIEDIDKRNQLIVELIKLQAQSDMRATVPWADAALKIFDKIVWVSVVVWWIVSVQQGRQFDIEQVAMILAGPAVLSFVARTRR